MLPCVYSSEKFRFSAGFIEVRALDAFLNRIATHPQLCMSEDLRNFLQADKEVWVDHGESKVCGGKGLVERSEYEKLKHYLLELEDHLAEVQQQSMKLVKRQQEVGQVFKGVNSLVMVCLWPQELDLLLIFEEPLKEYVCTVQAIEVVMADRAQAYREKLKLLRPDKAGKAEAEVTEIKDQSDEAKLRHEEIVRLMEQDMVQFQEAKTHDLGLVLNDFAHTQAQLTSDTANACQTLLIFVIPAWMKLK
ncbi:unnamed protein product [Sphagnum troendelagicum]|uniref:PX domain-containing protein n=1 Tax=Sphagnum troendelagicum TaxID=128251 RepID=A0ABP0TT83_9BRYO